MTEQPPADEPPAAPSEGFVDEPPAAPSAAGTLGVGRLAPELLDVAPWPYVVLGAGYAGLAIGLLVTGAYRQRQLQRAVDRGSHSPLRFPLVALFTACGVVLALATMVLV